MSILHALILGLLLFLLVSEVGCGLWLWHSLFLSLTFFNIVVFARPLWEAMDPNLLPMDSEDSDQTARMGKLIWGYAGRTCRFVDISCANSINSIVRVQICILVFVIISMSTLRWMTLGKFKIVYPTRAMTRGFLTYAPIRTGINSEEIP